MGFYSKQDQNPTLSAFAFGFVGLRASGRVRRPQRLPAAPVTLTQYPERYVVQRESSQHSRRRSEATADLADAPEIFQNSRILDDLLPVAFPLKTLSKLVSGKKWLTCGLLQQTGPHSCPRRISIYFCHIRSHATRSRPTTSPAAAVTSLTIYCDRERASGVATPLQRLLRGRRRHFDRVRNRSQFGNLRGPAADRVSIEIPK